MQQNKKAFIIGISGRMGQSILNILPEYNLSAFGCSRIKDYKNFSAEIAASDFVIDFSHADNIKPSAEVCITFKKPYFCGTTGISDKEMAILKNAAATVPVMYASNTSFGVAILKKAVELVTKKLGESADVEIIETHHKFKKDSPSGTALSIGETIADALGYSIADVKMLDGSAKIRNNNFQIGFSSLRGGNVVGEHSVNFFMNNETIKLTHECLNRKVFAEGALKSALWLFKQKPGFYTIDNMLE